jgi:hypothetical protein
MLLVSGADGAGKVRHLADCPPLEVCYAQGSNFSGTNMDHALIVVFVGWTQE